MTESARVNASGFGVDKKGAGNSIGLTNQKQGQQWSNLVGNDDLTIKAAAYNLEILNDKAASHAMSEIRASQPVDQFLGSGFDASGKWERSQAVALGNDTVLSNEMEHGQSTLSIYNLANQILCGSGGGVTLHPVDGFAETRAVEPSECRVRPGLRHPGAHHESDTHTQARDRQQPFLVDRKLLCYQRVNLARQKFAGLSDSQHCYNPCR